MAWEEITPARGERRPGGQSVSVAWRSSGSGKNPFLIVTASRSVVSALGWEPKARLAMARDRVAGLLRIQMVDAGGFSACISRGFLTQKVYLRDLVSEPRSAEHVEYSVEGNALVLELPSWAAPERSGMAGAVRARDAALARVEQAPPPRPPAVPAAPTKAPYIGITARMPDPNAGRRIG